MDKVQDHRNWAIGVWEAGGTESTVKQLEEARLRSVSYNELNELRLADMREFYKGLGYEVREQTNEPNHNR